jgi:hypothetical protein
LSREIVNFSKYFLQNCSSAVHRTSPPPVVYSLLATHHA